MVIELTTEPIKVVMSQGLNKQKFGDSKNYEHQRVSPFVPSVPGSKPTSLCSL